MITLYNDRFLKTNDGIVNFDISKNDWFNFNEMLEVIKEYSKKTLKEYAEYFAENYGEWCDIDTIKIYAYLEGE